jgi:hypothetical protein
MVFITDLLCNSDFVWVASDHYLRLQYCQAYTTNVDITGVVLPSVTQSINMLAPPLVVR